MRAGRGLAAAVAGLAAAVALSGCQALHEVEHLAHSGCYYAPILGGQYAQLGYAPIHLQRDAGKVAKTLRDEADLIDNEVAEKGFPADLRRPWSDLADEIRADADDPAALLKSPEFAAAGKALGEFAKKRCGATSTPTPPPTVAP